MRCRDSIVLTDGNCGLTSEAIYLHGFTTAGEHIAIEKIQTNIPELEDAGRLTFNSSVVPVRSLSRSGATASKSENAEMRYMQLMMTPLVTMALGTVLGAS